MKYFILFLILFFAVIFETALVQLPLVLISLLLIGIIFQEQWIFLVAFFSGLLLDMAAFRTIGESSLFFVVLLGIVFLYKRKFEIQSLPFVVVTTLLASSFYLFLFGSSVVVLQALVSVGLSAGIFFIFQRFIGNAITIKRGLL